MKLLDILKQVSASFEVTKSIQSFIFKTSLNLDELKNEQISLKVVSGLNGKPLEITKGFVSLKQFLMSSTYGQTLASDKNYPLISLINLTTGGFIPLDGTTVLRVELQNLNDEASYSFNGTQSAYQAERIHIYDAFNANKESVAFDFNVLNYDLIMIPILPTISEVILFYATGLQASFTLQELKDLFSCATAPVQITQEGTLQQSYNDVVLLPISGINSIQLRKDKDTAVEMFMRLNVFN